MPLGRRSNVLKALLRLEAQGVLDEFDDATHRWDVRSIYNMINQGWVLYGIVGSTNIDPNGQFLRVCVCVFHMNLPLGCKRCVQASLRMSHIIENLKSCVFEYLYKRRNRKDEWTTREIARSNLFFLPSQVMLLQIRSIKYTK